MQRWAKWAIGLVSNEAVVPELRVGRERIFAMAVVLRSTMAVCLAVAMILFADDHTNFLVVAVALTTVGAAPVSWRAWRRHRMLPPQFSFRDVVFLSIYAAFQPELRPFCMFLSFSVIGYAAITLRRSSALAVALIGSIGMSLAAAIGRDGNWLAAAVSFPLGALSLALPAISITAALSRERETSNDIMRELGVCLFEVPADAVTPAYIHGDTRSLRGHAPELYTVPGFWESLLHPDDGKIGQRMDADYASGQPYRARYRQRHADGHYAWVEEVALPTYDLKGAISGFRGLTFDVTDAVERGQHLDRLDTLIENLTTAVGVLQLTDLDDPTSLTWIYANQSATAMLGIGDLVGRRLIEVLPDAYDDEHHRGFGNVLAHAASNGTSLEIADAHIPTTIGERTMAVHVNPLPDHQIAVMCEDMTELYTAQAELERRVYCDDLTGLARRVKILEALATAEIGSMVAVLDLDQFKEINEAFGHGCGDELLREVAQLLAEAPPDVVVARFGGDEFGFFIPPGSISPEEAGRRLSEALRRPIVLPSGLTLQTSGSVGVTTKLRKETSPDELLRQADVAMNQAKRSHSGFVVYEAADDTSAPHRMMLLGEIRRAIRNHELELHYQPIVDCTTGDIVRLEALMRWRHPTLGMLPPSDFIELTEMSNLNTDVVLHTLEMAITDLQRWIDAGYGTPVSINIAGTTLHDARLMDSIMGRVERTRFPRHLLGIELTERQLLLGSGQSIRSLERLKHAGLWLSIDDFGTGTSSLAALRQIPAHELKIDKSFVDDLRTGDSVLIGTIVAMAHQLGLSVVAEGVEDEVTWRWLQANGADYAQGYYFARPAPAAAIEALLAGATPSWKVAR